MYITMSFIPKGMVDDDEDDETSKIEDLNNRVRIVEKVAISRLEKQQYEIMKSINRIEALEERCKHNLNGLEAIDRRVTILEEEKS